MDQHELDGPGSQLKFSDFLFPLFLIAMVAVGIAFRGSLMPLLSKREALREWIRGWGAWGWAAFLILQVLQVVIFVIPGEVVQISGGFIFGFWGGLVLTTTGIALGSACNFMIGKTLGKRFLKSVLSMQSYQKLQDYVADARGLAALMVLFFIPGIPKDLLCYAAGASGRSLAVFLAASMVARMPGILGSTLAGSATYRGQYGLVMLLAVLAALFAALLIVYRSRIEQWFLSHRSGRREGGKG
ncbi:MAG: VTT domain-containing protein [Spirochaetaceae bacterium]|nr:VTT domain-containing protein [Spirochaetaceae bacterium]